MSPAPAARPPPPGRFVRAAGGLELHVEEWAPPVAADPAVPPIVLLHGYLAATHVWAPVAARLAGRTSRRVLALDLPGCGHSARPAAPEAYALEAVTEAVLGALDALTPAPGVVLGGHSLGGAVALHAAARAPAGRFGALVLVSPLCYPIAPPSVLRWAAQRPAPFLRFFRSALGRRTIRPLMRRNFAGLPDAVALEAIELAVSHLAAPGGFDAALHLGLAAAHRRPIEPLLARLELPVLALWGAQDRVHPAAFAARLARELPRCDAHVLPAVGHNPHLERPDEVVSLAAGWLAQHLAACGFPAASAGEPARGSVTSRAASR